MSSCSIFEDSLCPNEHYVFVVYLEMTIQVKQITPVVNIMTILKLIRKGLTFKSL